MGQGWASLDLYETAVREPVAHIDHEGIVTNRAGERITKVPDAPGYFKRNGEGNPEPSEPPPRILFADVPVMLHLSCGLTIAPMDEALDSERALWRRTGAP